MLFLYYTINSTNLKNLVIVKQFQVNEDNKLVLCNGEFILGKEGIHGIELSGGTTVIDTETSKIMFLSLFEDSIMCILWEWIQNKDMHMWCKHAVSEAFPWITDKRNSKLISY